MGGEGEEHAKLWTQFPSPSPQSSNKDGLYRALVELWAPNSLDSHPGVLLGYTFLFLLLPSLFPASFSYLLESTQ